MAVDRRRALLERVHADLDDDLARSVYADHLLELGDDDAWHGELIRLQLDNAAPERITRILRDRQTRSLGPLVRLYDVTWNRGFPERLRTRKFNREHVEHLASSKHLPTIVSVEIGFMRAPMLHALLAKPEVTSRITELNLCSPTPKQLDELLAAAKSFPRLRRLGLGLEPMSDPLDQRLRPESLGTLLESTLCKQLDVVSKAIVTGELDEWTPELRAAPRTLTELDLLEVNDAGDAHRVTVYVRDRGALAPSRDRVRAAVALLRADGDAGFASETRHLTVDELDAIATQLARDGLAGEAKTVREIANERR